MKTRQHSGFNPYVSERWLILMLIAAAVLVGISGMKRLPMDNHEALVVQTAREMQSRDDWILPWFNGEPRLNKPPLSYWLTGIAANIFQEGDLYRAWHGRLVSLLAGLGLVVCTLISGHLLFNNRVALQSSFILITTSGWFTYTHDARPDILYAFMCTLGMTGFLVALVSASEVQRRVAGVVAWSGMALAVLAKGPHMPLAYLGGTLLWALSLHLPLADINHRLKPLTGMFIVVLLAGPWWLLVNQHADIRGLENTQLSGSLLTMHPRNLLDLYYFYRPLILFLPWVLLLPFTLIRIKYNGLDSGIKFALIMIILPALMLETGPQKRWYYLLPSIMPMCLLLGAGMEELQEMIRGRKIPAFAVIAGALAIALGTILYHSPGVYITPAGQIFREMTVLFLLGLAFLSITGFQLAVESVFPVIFLIYFVTYLYLGNTLSGWSTDRFEREILAEKILSVQEPQSRIMTMGIEPGVYTFYTGTKIKPVRTPAEIESIRQNHSVVLLVNPGLLDTLPEDFRIIGTVQSSGKTTDVAVYAPHL
jgi:4-amino-4-deoxy-L-arabinose transferase-like glycosyltransferase